MEYSDDPDIDLFIKEYIQCEYDMTDELANLRYSEYMTHIQKPIANSSDTFIMLLSNSYIHIDINNNIRYNVYSNKKIYSCITKKNKLIAVEVYGKEIVNKEKVNKEMIDIAINFWKCF